MILIFATKRDINGNRYRLYIDCDNKQYSTEGRHWLCREDFTEISKTDRRRLLFKLSEEGYTAVDCL